MGFFEDILPIAGTVGGGLLGGPMGAVLGGGLGSMFGGRSATGEPLKMTSTTGPLTPEGQQLWDMVMGQLQKTPPTRNIKFAGNNWTFRTPNYNNLALALMNMDASRRGTMVPFTPDQGGILGGLAPILGAMAGQGNKNEGANLGNPLDWLLGGTSTGGGGYASS